MKKKVTTNITKKDYVYIDGSTGKQLTKEEFVRKHKHGGINLGGNRAEDGQKEQGGRD